MLIIQREIEQLLEEHTAISGGVDGLCRGCDANGEHHADHIVSLLVAKYDLPWERNEKWKLRKWE